MKKYLLLLLSILLVASIAVGCGAEQKSQKEILIDGLQKSKEVNSMTFDGSMKLAFDFSKMNTTNQDLQMLTMFPDLEFTYDGKETADPVQAEMTIKSNMNVQGMNLSFDIPIIIKDNVVYIKIPGIFKSQLQMLDPTMDPSKEYISMDLTEAMQAYDPATTKEDQFNMMKSIIDTLDESYFVNKDAKNYSIENGSVSEAVSFKLTQDNIKPFLKEFLKEGMPYVLDQLDKYSTDEETKAQFQQAKDELEKGMDEAQQSIDELDKYLTINNLEFTTVYDKDNNVRKQILDVDVIIKDETQGSIGVKFTLDQNINNVNENINFELPVPSKDQVIDMSQYAQMGSSF